MMRMVVYAGASLALSMSVILKALHQRSNFYSACVYLSQSNANLMILTNVCLLVVGFFLFGLQRLLYGRLRPIETEQLYEKAWFAVTETCLAMTIFRGELGGWFVVMFVCLLIGKVWGWIGEGRVDILEQQPPSNPRLFHTRLAVSLLLAVFFNSFMLKYAVKTVLRQARPDMMVMFGFEFAVLTILSTSTTARYALSLAEIYIVRQQKLARLAERRAEIRASREEILRTCQDTGSEPPRDLPNEDSIEEMELDVPGWEEKGRCVFYLDLATDFLKLVVYLFFFAILFTFYGLPIHILRDVVLTMRSFVKRVLDFIRYRNATRDMNHRYPDANAEEIAREDVCIICREEMHPWQPFDTTNVHVGQGRAVGRMSERLRPKKLPCGHLLHFSCLRSWLERQQNCPTCRRPVTMTGRAQGGPDGEDVVARANQHIAGNAQAPAGRPRAWVLNLGPLRVGFGAGRGDQFQDGAQQLNAGQPLVNQAANQNQNPLETHQPPTSFGFGSGNLAPTESLSRVETTSANIQDQILTLERQINQEINSLLATSDQLHVVRLLQNELIRLRAINSNRPSSGISNVRHPIISSSSNTSQPAFQHHFVSNPTLTPGEPSLPEGITLPPGWTILPLQNPHPPAHPLNLRFNGLSFPSHRSSLGQAPFSSHLSADSSQSVSAGGPSNPPVAPPATLSEQESQPTSEHHFVQASMRPKSKEPGNQPTSPSQDLSEITPKKIVDGTESSIMQRNSSQEPLQGLSNGAELSSQSSPDLSAVKGKSRAATVEDFEE
ncbi:E3 ubiquitin-protein ligase hrd1 [Coccidioides posadasii str. Silveira]|uniref:RING-type E3 ubiquitin transferase n=3 Tax=Coccidioides posadasii TaxID=199306 RepID=E9CTH6_COCPS|nr:C3HC4 type (RING finger) zinc finger containing protein [Coccidioides posadasii C735 delta SOWgp]EER28578.1 C3HC4 type (RING finger) zinc finger containing protein [Coccidioides posadasii C735 delta SOWgp]EFW22121.1 RING finger protein [Coccidioides posadasii str. Silveira]QVM06443.1 E3 ubiquitin-protein ligase hrd1 [Coccidioides posadasii str. Silveira]|eukprot:XP_003070723.1 C3HC4 type (RING finger) zinc finger containing protein [Coccidioides posadasii C735 delta SOWgp]